MNRPPISAAHATTSHTLLLKPRKHLGLVAISLAFVLTGIWMLRDGEWSGWVCISLFGLFLVILLVAMLPGASYLRLTTDGFTVCALFRPSTYRWVDVSFFGVGRVIEHRMVMFNFVDTYQQSPKARALNARLTGFEASLPDTFGLKHEELAELMNKFKAAS